jgi:hypothetical protein
MIVPEMLLLLLLMMMIIKVITPRIIVILEKLIVPQLVNTFPPFIEPSVSITCSQEPSSGSYPEVDEYSPHLTSCSINTCCNNNK